MKHLRLLALLLCGFTGEQDVKMASGKPLPPKEALKTFTVAPGFRIDLVAAEPEVMDPVAMAFDEDGRVYVAEMADYPLGPPSGRITGRVLASDNGRPVKRARVFISAAELPGGRGMLTDDGGVFDFTELPAGRYTLTVSKAGFVSLSYGQRRPLQAGTPLQLAESEQLKGIQFQLPRGSVLGGRVLDEDGDAMPGVTVRVMRYQYLQGARSLTPAGSAQTDDKGQYRVWGLMPGDYYVNAVMRGNFGGGFAGGFGGGGFAGPFGPGGRGGGRGGPAPGSTEQEQINYAPT